MAAIGVGGTRRIGCTSAPRGCCAPREVRSESGKGKSLTDFLVPLGTCTLHVPMEEPVRGFGQVRGGFVSRSLGPGYRGGRPLSGIGTRRKPRRFLPQGKWGWKVPHVRTKVTARKAAIGSSKTAEGARVWRPTNGRLRSVPHPYAGLLESSTRLVLLENMLRLELR
jgi:hypothetical protein